MDPDTRLPVRRAVPYVSLPDIPSCLESDSVLLVGIIAGCFHTLSKTAFIVCFALLQFFFNFGANTTTYCYPAEVFPTRFRAFAHGISAACGKVGAIISALAFNTLSKKVGTPVVMWIFFGCCIFGARSLFSCVCPLWRAEQKC